jgi:hypothetical protein
VDPLARDYPELTPFQFASNTPIWAIDIDGLEAGYIVSYNVFIDKYGNYVTEKLHDPVLTTTNGDWSGVRTESQFFHNGDFVGDNQGKIPGWSAWRNSQQEKFYKRVSSVGKVAGGIVAIGAAIPTSGASLTTLGALGTGFSIAAGSYSIAKGMTDFTISFTDNHHVSEIIPEGILNATVGITFKSFINNNEVSEYIEMSLDVIEGATSFKVTDATNLQKLNTIISGKDISIEAIKFIDKSNDDGKTN